MKRITTILSVVFIASLAFISCKPKEKAAEYYDYDVTYEKIGNDGTTLFKVWGQGKNFEKAKEQSRKNAVHAIIFKGIPGSNMAKPLCTKPDAEQQNAEYFNTFFKENGKYLKYLKVSGDGVADRVKVKGGMKVAIIASVNHAALRKELEAHGIVRKLDSGF